MTFNSAVFLLFFPIVLLFHFFTPKKYRVIPLLIASYYFYASWNFGLMSLILFTTAVSYFAGIYIEKTDSKKVKKLLLTVTLIACFGVLFFFKYFNFFSSVVFSAARLFGAAGEGISLKLILPVGISFYTFQTLSYVIDVYRGSIRAERNFLYYALFVSFFPQLVAGPIERPENLLPQLKSDLRPERENFIVGGSVMLIGYFKKIAVADFFAGYVNTVYNSPENASGASVILASVLFAVQIYCDFSGYTDIAIGAARIMGIRLMRNFDRPYSSRSVREFWSRWHISLSSWFKDYLYIPLGGNRKGTARTLLNILIVFAVSGLWHGADTTFIVWGVLHGVYQIIGRLTWKARRKAWEKLGVPENGKFLSGLRVFNTFVLTTFAWIFFRANNVADLGTILGKLFTSWDTGILSSVRDGMGFTATSAVLAVLLLVTLMLLDRRMSAVYTEEKGNTVSFDRSTALLLVWTVIAAWLLLYAGGGASTFIYFQF